MLGLLGFLKRKKKENVKEEKEEAQEEAGRHNKPIFIKLNDGRVIMAKRIIDASGDQIVYEDLVGNIRSVSKSSLAS